MSAAFQLLLRDKRKREETAGAVRFVILEQKSIEISEIYLQANGSTSFAPGNYLIVPIHGVLELKLNGDTRELFPSQFLYFPANGGFTLEACGELSRCFVAKLENSGASYSGEYDAELRNALQKLVADPHFQLHIGIFDGRKEASYAMKNRDALVVCVNGAFEFENRLLETSDSLLIRNASVLEMEALSENAILIILDFQGNID